MKKLLFIFNPATGNGALKNRLMEILCTFSGAGYALSVWPTHGPGDAKKIAGKYGKKHDLVVCCGGDGTLSEVVDGLTALEAPPPLGYIPGGTTCDFATSLRIPKSDMRAATKRIVQSQKLFPFDVGCFNGRAFSYVAAFGAFTDISYKTPQKNKNALGHVAYLLEAMPSLAHMKTTHIRVRCPGESFEADCLVGMVSNSTSVAGFTFSDNAKVRMDDGKMEMLLVNRPQNIAELGALSAAILRGDTSSPLLKLVRISQAQVESDEPIAWTLDGEFGGETAAADISVLHKALAIYL